MNKTKRQRLTASVLTFVIIFQTIAGVFIPNDVFKAQEAHAGWYDAGYGYKKEIKVDHTKVSPTDHIDQTNFPMLVSFTDPLLKTTGSGGKVTNANGYDIIFTNASGTQKLDHEIEKYVPTTGGIVMWVKIPVLSASVDTSIYIYYGNAAITTTQENKTGVWDDGGGNNFKMVQHMNQTGTGQIGDYKDSTQYGNNSISPANQPTATTSGKIGNAESFSAASSQYISASWNMVSGASQRTISHWFKTSSSANANWISWGADNPAQLNQTGIYAGVIGALNYDADVSTGVNPYIDDKWHQISWSFDGAMISLYLDGVLISSANRSLNTASSVINFGRAITGAFYSTVVLDEIKITNVARSAGWIATEYNNQSEPTEFSTLGIEEVSSPSALSSFAYRKAITIDHTKVSGASSLTNFPVLINLPTDASLAAHAQTDNDDILFTSSTVAWNTGTTNDKLAHEIETYTTSTGSLQAWVKIPNLSSTTDTVIYMYYGNGSVPSQNNKTAVWDNNTKAAWHLKETGTGVAGDYKDSTQYANHSTNTTSQPTAAVGQIDGGQNLNGSQEIYFTSVNNALKITSNVTIDAWVYPTWLDGYWRKLAGNSYFDHGYALYSYGQKPTLKLSSVGGGYLMGNTTIPLNQWSHIVGTYDGSTMKVYLNGNLDGSVAASGTIASGVNWNSRLGASAGYSMQFTGSEDEVRISNTARSAGWIATEYNNQSQPTEFSTLGIEEVSSPSALSTFAYRKAITIDHTKVSGATNLSNFPVLINLPTDASLAAHAQSTGNDILFTSSTTNWNTGTTNDKLAHEIETYTATGSLQAWVKIPSLNSASASQDTVIYMYYGNATATNQQNKTAVWDTNTKMVQHMNQNPGGAAPQMTDSTLYGNNGTTSGSMASNQLVTGQIDGATSFDGSNDYASMGNVQPMKQSFTVEMWHKRLGNGSGVYGTLLGIDTGSWSGPTGGFVIFDGHGGSISARFRNHIDNSEVGANLETSVSDNVWKHYTVVWNKPNLTVYRDGQYISNTVWNHDVGWSVYNMLIGNWSGTSYNDFGITDEVRISNTARSADWIATEYNNQSQPTEFSTLGIEEVSSPSALSSFAYRKAITIDHTKVSGTTNLTNFPVLINLPTDDSLRLHAQNPSGNDILFTSSSINWNTGTTNDKLAHEIETYTAANGSLQAWVKIPSLNSASASQDTVIYMYYGNATAPSQQNKTAVWDTNTKMVQHMNQTGNGQVGDYKDSTSNGNNSTNTANQPTVTTGQIDGAEIFNGTSSYVDAGNGTSLNITNALTISAWVNFADLTLQGVDSSKIGTIVVKGDAAAGSNSVNAYSLFFDNTSANQLYFSAIQNSTTASGLSISNFNTLVTTNSWHRIVATYSPSFQAVYLDGVLKNSTTSPVSSIQTVSNDFRIGSSTNNRRFNGSIDEVRISNTARSAEWIATEYNNQSQPTEFLTLGIEEVSSPSALSSFAYRKTITIDHTKVSGTTNLTNFPVLINLPTDTSLAAHAQNPSGNDILFTSSTTAWNTGTTNDKLAHEIETYTTATGSLQAWVKIPTLNASSASQDTVIYMYYGNATATNQQNKTAVWDMNTKMVQHMNQDPSGTAPQMIDSTQYGNYGTTAGSMTSGQLVSGNIGKAIGFDGTNDYLTIKPTSDTALKGQIYTLSMWTYINRNNPNDSELYAVLGGNTTGVSLFFNVVGFLNNGNFYNCSVSSALNLNTWQYTSVIIDRNQNLFSVFVNGVYKGQSSFPAYSPTGTIITIGKNAITGNAGDYLLGFVDEINLSNTARSADWIATEYSNQSAPGTFIKSLGAENIYRLEITGSATQTAGVSQPVTLYAKDAAGNTMTNFTGDKSVTLGGASASPNSTNPTCSDKNATDIPFGAPTTLNFVSGVATCNLKLFKAESASVTSTGISTITSNLSVTVSPNTLTNFLVDAPASSNSGAAFATVITSRDFYNNTTRTVSGSTALSVNSGSISPSSISVGNFTDDGVWSGNLTISNITEQPSVAITATNTANTGTDSISILGIPANPQNASASRNTDYSITTTWQDSSTVESGFRIERKVNDGSWSAYTEIGTVGAGITTFTDNSASNPANAPVPDRAYQYRVRAYNTIGNSAGYSEDSTIHYTTPNVPSNVFSSYLTDNSFRVNYTDNAAVTNTHRIQRCSNANCGISYETDLSTFTSSPQTDSTSINPNSRYRWQARSETPDGLNSNYASSNFEYTTPAAPTIQSTTYVSGSQLIVNWTDSSSYEDGFRIEVSTDNGAYTEITPGTNTVGANINVYAFTSLPDHNYKFKVRSHIGSTAHNSEIFSSYSGESVAVYTTSSAPTISAPTVNSSTSINWHWTDNSAFEESFRLHFVSGSGTDVNNLPANSTGYETNGLTPNTKYAVHIHSYRADTGESDPSNLSAEVYTFANIPIMSLTADSERKITAHWNANQNPLGTKYFIENMSTGADSDWIENTSWSSDELFCGEEYSFRIKARNESNIETAFSDAVSVKTANCPPGIPVSAGNPPQAPAKTEDNPQGVFKVSINKGEKYTNNPVVHLDLLAGADTNRLAISNTADFKNASIVPYTQEMDWDMNTPPSQEGNQSNTQTQGCENPLLRGELKGCVGFEDGLHTVYVKFYTQYGVASSAVSYSIILDTTAPGFTLSNLKANYTINDAISLQGVTEPNTKLVYNLDSQRVGVLNTTNTKFTIDLGKLTEGNHSLKIFAQDALGNSSDTMPYFINIVKPITLPVPVPEVPGTGVKPKPPTTTPTPTGIPTITNPNSSVPAITPASPTQPGINVPSLNTPTNNNTNPDNPDIDTGNISPQTPASMQGEWNLLTLKPLPQQLTQEDIRMIIQKFPEFKKTFQDLGIEDFQNTDKLKNVSLNLPSLSDILGLNPTNLSANLPDTSTPIASLNPTFKKGIPENIVFIKTQGDNIDINSALNFENGTANQKVSLLSGKTFQLLIRPDQEVKAIQGYITFKESKVSKAETPQNLISKISSLIHRTSSVYAADNIEEKLVLSEFSYQDDDKDGIWSAEIQTPQVSGEYELINVLQYKDIKLGSKAIRLITVVDPEGYVYRTEADGIKARVPDAVVSIYWFNSETKTYELWDAAKYQQQNPQTTDDRGTYSFLVPPGSYYLKVETKGYTNYESKPFDVTAGSGVHMNLEVKLQSDWKDRFNWQNLIIVVFGIALCCNFYTDRKLKKRLKAKNI